MSISLSDSSNENGDAIQSILQPGCGFTAVKPKATVGKVTILRFLPEVAEDGSILPMVTGMDENGPHISSFHKEPVALFAGTNTKFHGIVRPSDRMDSKHPDMPFAGLFIQLKGDMNHSRVPDQHYKLVAELLRKPANSSAPLASIQDSLLARVIVIQLSGEAKNPVMTKAVAAFSPAGIKAIAQTITEAHAAGDDLFDPVKGHALMFTPFTIPGGVASGFQISDAGVMPLTPELWDGKFVPWSQLLKYHTYDTLIAKMVQAYGPTVVAMKPSFYEDMRRLKIGTGDGSAQASPSNPPAPSAWSQPAQAATVAPAAPLVKPAGATGGWGAPAPAAVATTPAAPVPAPTAGGWGAVKPAATTTTMGSVADLEAAFKAKLNEKK